MLYSLTGSVGSPVCKYTNLVKFVAHCLKPSDKDKPSVKGLVCRAPKEHQRSPPLESHRKTAFCFGLDCNLSERVSASVRKKRKMHRQMLSQRARTWGVSKAIFHAACENRGAALISTRQGSELAKLCGSELAGCRIWLPFKCSTQFPMQRLLCTTRSTSGDYTSTTYRTHTNST